MKPSKLALRCVAACALVLGYALPANAQVLNPTGEMTPFGPNPRVAVDEQKPNDTRSIRVATKTSRLFDLSTTISSVQLDAGPIWYRRQAAGRDGFERGTGELALGTVTTANWKPFYLAGHHKLVFRAFDSKSYHVSFSSDMATGIGWGPFELETRIGLNAINVGAFHGDWSAELLSPRVSAAAALHVWRIRVDIQAHSEYLWRWFGNDYLVRGITLGLRIDIPQMDKPLTNKSPAR